MKISLMLLAPGLLAPALLTAPARAEVRPVGIFTDNMMFQQGIPAPVWGTGNPGEAVEVTFAGQKHTTTAGQDGKWKVTLKPLVAGGPHELKVNERTARNVLVGEVWVASGQSNMAWPVSKTQNAEADIAASSDPQLRMFTFSKAVANEPSNRVSGIWKEAAPDKTGGFSATAYYFARKLRKELNVPVGIVSVSRGGTAAEAWTSREALLAEPALKERMALWDKLEAEYPVAKEKFDKEVFPAWQAAVEKAKAEGKPLPRQPRPPEGGPGDSSVPSNLFNAMIHPLVGYGIKGFIWYQGEANATAPEEYRALFPALIKDWRTRWGQGDIPFLWAQLANNGRKQTKPVEGGWARIRESQMMALALPNTGMAVITDTSASGNLHPPEKQPVGERLATAALALAYKKGGVVSGPIYLSMKREGNAIRIRFSQTGSGLEAKDGKLSGFAIAGADNNFVWAEAQIEGDSVLVSSPKVPAPTAVRYGWGSNPMVSLYNKEGLPASSFRTDTESK